MFFFPSVIVLYVNVNIDFLLQRGCYTNITQLILKIRLFNHFNGVAIRNMIVDSQHFQFQET